MKEVNITSDMTEDSIKMVINDALRYIHDRNYKVKIDFIAGRPSLNPISRCDNYTIIISDSGTKLPEDTLKRLSEFIK